ncbi:MAG: FRG domain-containing protein, partial [Thermoguttaceae bacterium]
DVQKSAPGAWWTQVTSDWSEFCSWAERACGSGASSGNAFRGQSDTGWSLKTSLLRLAEQAGLSAAKTIDVEESITKEFASLAHLHVTLLSDPIIGTIPWWPWMQHYRAPTRLLDWSMSPYVALYFAVEQNWQCDGAVWGFAINELRDRMTQKYGGGNATDDPKLSRLFSKYDAPAHVSVVSSERYSERMAAQQGLFTLCTQVLADHDEAIGESTPGDAELAHSFKFVIPKDAKPDFLRRLRRMNITAGTLFPGADGLGRSLGEKVRLAGFGV